MSGHALFVALSQGRLILQIGVHSPSFEEPLRQHVLVGKATTKSTRRTPHHQQERNDTPKDLGVELTFFICTIRRRHIAARLFQEPPQVFPS
jgi:hypothetical protein